jgi:hypothetical protein
VQGELRESKELCSGEGGKGPIHYAMIARDYHHSAKQRRVRCTTSVSSDFVREECVRMGRLQAH